MVVSKMKAALLHLPLPAFFRLLLEIKDAEGERGMMIVGWTTA
jgi:hypothetical protein